MSILKHFFSREQDGNTEPLRTPRFSALKVGYELPLNIAVMTLQVGCTSSALLLIY